MLSITGTSAAETPDSVIYLEKGVAAPFSGFLFTPEKEKQLRLIDTENEYNLKKMEIYKTIITNQENELTLYNKRLENYRVQNDKLAQVNQSSDFLNKTLYFILGAVLTGAVGYGVYRSK